MKKFTERENFEIAIILRRNLSTYHVSQSILIDVLSDKLNRTSGSIRSRIYRFSNYQINWCLNDYLENNGRKKFSKKVHKISKKYDPVIKSKIATVNKEPKKKLGFFKRLIMLFK